MEARLPTPQEEKLKVKVSENLEADRVRLLIDQPFVGAFLIRQNLVPVVDSRCETAATDGQNIFVNPVFYLGLTPAERRFLLAHEVWHCVFLHFLRRNGRDRELFNIASDMEINIMLKRESFKLPAGALLPRSGWEKLNAEEMYDRLQQSPPQNISMFDDHPEPDDPQKDVRDVEEEDIVFDPDFKVDFGDHPEDSVREKVIEAAVQCEKMRGELPGKIAQIVENFRAGKLHWKEILAQFVTSCFGGSRRWLPPNRRYISGGLYLQSRRDFKLKAVLAIDTSGSTSNDLPVFAGELANLLGSFGQYELKVICCDTVIQSVTTYSEITPFDGKINFSGGGGTSFSPVFEYLEKQSEDPNLLIYFTDGYGDHPAKPSYPVLWVITPDGKNSIPWGYETSFFSK